MGISSLARVPRPDESDNVDSDTQGMTNLLRRMVHGKEEGGGNNQILGEDVQLFVVPYFFHAEAQRLLRLTLQHEPGAIARRCLSSAHRKKTRRTTRPSEKIETSDHKVKLTGLPCPFHPGLNDLKIIPIR